MLLAVNATCVANDFLVW